jgi:cyclopropane fatty-acyl-phospholipid synthase-like methyltransferase
MSETSIQAYFDSLAGEWDSLEHADPQRVAALFKKLDLHPGEKALDIACGTGVVTGLIHRYTNAPVLGIDLSKEMVAIAKKKYAKDNWASFLATDFIQWQSKERFDYAIVYDAYPHFLEPELFEKQLAHILTKQGRFAIVHSLSREELKEHHDGHCPAFSRDLKTPSEEAKVFEKDFKILRAEEDEHSYLILGQKKSIR